MAEILKSLIKHSIVVLVNRREKGISLNNFLSRLGFRVYVAVNLYEANQLIEQEMPHLVITEATFSDGDASTLFDKIKNHEILNKTPILVHIPKKSRQELEIVASRAFAGFILGPLEPKTLMGKLGTIVDEQCKVSPFYVETDSHMFNKELTISMEGRIVGKSKDVVISESGFEIDSIASLLCIPKEKKYNPAVFRMPSNLKSDAAIYNLFPINKVVGKGRQWVNGLPEINLRMSDGQDQLMENKVVIYFDSVESRFKQFSKILQGFDIELVYAPTLSRCISLVRQRCEDIGCIYLHELINDKTGIEWKNDYMKIPPEQRPPLIIGTSSLNARSTPDIRFIKRPFGMGVFIENIKSAFIRTRELAQGVKKTGYQGISVQYKTSAKILGLDESGGVMQVSFPVLGGSSLSIDHDFFKEVWGEGSVAHVEGSEKVNGKGSLWQVRFRSVDKGSSKSRYWAKMVKALEGSSGLADGLPGKESA